MPACCTLHHTCMRIHAHTHIYQNTYTARFSIQKHGTLDKLGHGQRTEAVLVTKLWSSPLNSEHTLTCTHSHRSVHTYIPQHADFSFCQTAVPLPQWTCWRLKAFKSLLRLEGSLLQWLPEDDEPQWNSELPWISCLERGPPSGFDNRTCLICGHLPQVASLMLNVTWRQR